MQQDKQHCVPQGTIPPTAKACSAWANVLLSLPLPHRLMRAVFFCLALL